MVERSDAMVIAANGPPALAEVARTIGVFFSGLGPGFAKGGDALLMQWLGTPLETGKLQIYSD
jgi:hypothetical protein